MLEPRVVVVVVLVAAPLLALELFEEAPTVLRWDSIELETLEH